MYSYWYNSFQRTKVNEWLSGWTKILAKISQVSTLGQLLFNILSNDIFLFINNTNLYNYADDNALCGLKTFMW